MRMSTVFVLKFHLQMPSPALSRVFSPNHMHVLLLKGGGGGGGEGGTGCTRLVMSIGELTLGPFPC